MTVSGTANVTKMQGEYVKVKLSLLEADPNQPRKYFRKKSIEQLAMNIIQYGQEIPVLLQPHPRKSGKFIIKDGERRQRAYKYIHETTGIEPEVLAIIKPYENDELRFRNSVIANLHREDMSELDEAQALAKLHRLGMSKPKLAELRGRSLSYIEGYILVDSLPQSVKDLMSYDLEDDKRLGITQAIEIARSFKSEKSQLEIAQEIIERNMGVVEARSFIGYRKTISGMSVGGYQRSPHDDYKVLTSFLGRLVRKSSVLADLNVAKLYEHRPNKSDDLSGDIKILEASVVNLQRLIKSLKSLEKK